MSAVFDTSSGNGKDAAREPLAVRIVRGSTAHDVFLHKNPQGQPLYYSKDGVSTGPRSSDLPQKKALAADELRQFELRVAQLTALL
ncbi:MULTISPECIES: hypothetical protein [Paraburkholderia]|uniref:hypothetical protein n=1 Tax=Paraburkholderia TaxID=1822464 RepID=UPI0020CC2412|nr:hypothetical protein [Paraburkholderia youngii]